MYDVKPCATSYIIAQFKSTVEPPRGATSLHRPLVDSSQIDSCCHFLLSPKMVLLLWRGSTITSAKEKEREKERASFLPLRYKRHDEKHKHVEKDH